jgi:hypothetical protein
MEHQDDPVLQPGRRKIRKGTHSCHECKRRKIKCHFLSRNDASCVGCRRRGTACVSQEFEGDASSPANVNPIVRVESLLQKILERLDSPRATLPPNTIEPWEPNLPTPELTVCLDDTPHVGMRRIRLGRSTR